MIGIYYSLPIDYKINLGIRGLTAHRFTKQDNREKRYYFLKTKTHSLDIVLAVLLHLVIKPYDLISLISLNSRLIPLYRRYVVR